MIRISYENVKIVLNKNWYNSIWTLKAFDIQWKTFDTKLKGSKYFFVWKEFYVKYHIILSGLQYRFL